MSVVESNNIFETEEKVRALPPSITQNSNFEPQTRMEQEASEGQPFNGNSQPAILELLNRASSTITAEREKVAELQRTVSTLKKHLHHLVQLSVEDHQCLAAARRNLFSTANCNGVEFPLLSSTMVWQYLASNSHVLAELLNGSSLEFPQLDMKALDELCSPPAPIAVGSMERSPPAIVANEKSHGIAQSPHLLTRRLSGSLSPGDPLSSSQNSPTSLCAQAKNDISGKKSEYAKKNQLVTPTNLTSKKTNALKNCTPSLPNSLTLSQQVVRQTKTQNVHKEIFTDQGSGVLYSQAEALGKNMLVTVPHVASTGGISTELYHGNDSVPQNESSASHILSFSNPPSTEISSAEAGMIARLRRAVAPPPTKYQMDEVVEAMIGELRKELKEKISDKTLDWPPVQKSLEKGTPFYYIPWVIKIEKENVCAYRFLVGPEVSVNTVIDIYRRRPGCSVDSILLKNQRARQDGQQVPKLDVKHFLVHLTIDSGKLCVVKGGGHTDLLLFLERKINLRL